MTNVAKGKRVRTGCLTCRERHLKCDEATPICAHCRRGSRRCRWGLKVNFLDIVVHVPARISRSSEWSGTSVLITALDCCYFVRVG